MTRKLVVEGIGTFFLMFTVGLVVATGQNALGPLGIGSALMVMVYAGGHISGGHYNPAVTLGVAVRGRTTWAELGGYWIAQLIAAAIAGGIAKLYAGGALAPLLPDFMAAGIVEFLFTFALVFVVLNVATTRGTEGNSYYGLAIGFTVMVGAVAAGSVSGAVFNPGVAVGLLVLGALEPGTVLFYIIAQLAGGLVAALVFRALDLGADKALTATPADQAKLQQAATT